MGRRGRCLSPGDLGGAEPGAYRPGLPGGFHPKKRINELYAAVVYEYLRSRGVRGLPCLGPQLRVALASAWWELGPGRRWYELRRGARRARNRTRQAWGHIRRLWDFAKNGTMPKPAVDLDDELPF